MSVSIKEVEKIAELARLHITENEKEKYTEQLNVILEYMEQLNRVDTSKVDPLSHPFELTNVFRADEIQPSLSIEEVLKNAPERSGNYFKVPKVISK
jgi:aspartyl-tRNA(Asn)/glutamyl-tRNA(Gln) amidotransferase subunit C